MDGLREGGLKFRGDLCLLQQSSRNSRARQFLRGGGGRETISSCISNDKLLNGQ